MKIEKQMLVAALEQQSTVEPTILITATAVENYRMERVSFLVTPEDARKYHIGSAVKVTIE